MNNARPFYEVMLERKDFYVKHERTFKRTFGVSIWLFMHIVKGFDIMKFDDWMRTPDGISTSDYTAEMYGDDGHALVMTLLTYGGTGEV